MFKRLYTNHVKKKYPFWFNEANWQLIYTQNKRKCLKFIPCDFIFWFKVIINRFKSTNTKVSKTNKLVRTGELPNFDEETQYQNTKYHNNKSEYKQSPNEKYMSLPPWIRNSNDCDYD